MEFIEGDLTHEVIAAAMEIHKEMGPGLLESAYRSCMMMELSDRGLRFQSEVSVPIIYKNRRVDCGFRADFLIEDKLVLELKAVENLLPIHESQVLTYLRLLNVEVGLLINFNVSYLRNGIRRCVLKSPAPHL